MHPYRFIAGLATLASCLVLTAPSFAAELTAEQLADILDDEGDGVCLVFDGVDVCSGVLLDRKGLIATSCRLGLSPLTLRAAVRVSRGKKVEIVEQLELVGVHPRQDVALLRAVDLDGKPTAIKRARRLELERGMQLATLLPGARFAQAKPENGNTPGLGPATAHAVTVGRLDEDLEGMNLTSIKFMPRPPGSAVLLSGAPALDSDGKLVGMLTLQHSRWRPLVLVSAEHIDDDEVVPVEERVPHSAEAHAWLEQGQGKFDGRVNRQGAEKDALLAEAFVHARTAAVSDPGLPAPHVLMARILDEIGQPEAARAYLEHALAVRPGNAPACHLLGERLAAQGLAAEAEALWKQGFLGDPATFAERQGRAHCGLLLARSLLDAGRVHAAAYLASWCTGLESASLGGGTEEMLLAQRAVFREAVSALEEEDPEAGKKLRARVGGWEPAVFEALLAGKDSSEATPDPAWVAMRGLAAEIGSDAPQPPVEGGVVEIPGRVAQAVPAGAGALWLLALEESREVVVVDIAHVRIAETLRFGSEQLQLAAGGGRFVVVDGERGRLHVHDARSLREERVLRAPAGGRLDGAVMGTLDGSRAVVSWIVEEGTHRTYGVADLDEGTVQPFENASFIAASGWTKHTPQMLAGETVGQLRIHRDSFVVEGLRVRKRDGLEYLLAPHLRQQRLRYRFVERCGDTTSLICADLQMDRDDGNLLYLIDAGGETVASIELPFDFSRTSSSGLPPQGSRLLGCPSLGRVATLVVGEPPYRTPAGDLEARVVVFPLR